LSATAIRWCIRSSAKAIVRELLIYDPVTGLFEWRRRDRKWFRSNHDWKTWNTKNAGKRAFTYTDDGCNTGSIFGLGVQAARVAFLYMTGRWPDPEVDHRNWSQRGRSLDQPSRSYPPAEQREPEAS
jgi:hypothetical protein